MSAYSIAKVMNDCGETGKLGGKWRSSNVLRTIEEFFPVLFVLPVLSGLFPHYNESIPASLIFRNQLLSF